MSGWVIGASAVVGAGVSYFNNQASNNAASNIANQQAGIAQQQAGRAQSGVANATNFAAATPQELNILGQSYQTANAQLQQQQKLMDSIDPSLMEASKQALAIMQGGTAASTQPMFAMRNQQRAQLVSSLQQQYGPGAESTSIGQRQLQQFDMQTQMMQQNAVPGLLGIASNGQAASNLEQANMGLQQVGQGYANIQTRQANAALGGVSALNPTNQSSLNTAGAGSVGNALRGQAGASFGNNIMNGGVTLGAAYMRGNPNVPAVNFGSGSSNNYGATGPVDNAGFQQLQQPSLGQTYGGSNNYALSTGQ